MQKCKESGADPHLAMLCLRTTPTDHHLPSPAELLNSRKYRSNLPAMTKPMLFTRDQGDVNAKLQVRQDLQKFYHDRSSKELSKLYPGNNVRGFNSLNRKWQPGMVREEAQVPQILYC